VELGPGEPAAGPWRVVPLTEFARAVADAAGTPAGRPRIVAVDGRGGGGKTSLSERLARVLPDTAVVHSDDVAWFHSVFDWDDLMIEGVLTPLHAGRAVHYQPPAWAPRGRHEHIDVPAGRQTVIIEGVGVSRPSLLPWLDTTIWVQSDFADARRRALVRDRAEQGRSEAEAVRQWEEWEAEEVPFLAADRPWDRAAFIVGTGPELAHDRDSEVSVSAPIIDGHGRDRGRI
jgi:uridine kinase